MLRRIALVVVLSLPLAAWAAEAGKTAPPLPRLIVQITVDQLRGDLPLRHADQFPEGGFRLFLDNGVWYAAAHHDHAYSETIVGHTTLATGAWPARHGMIANSWWDDESGKKVENIEDPDYSVLQVADESSSGGVSPKAILTTTFSDELSISTAGRAKVFGVSMKDRGAVPMAGHNGKAFWYSSKNGCFVTSSFYYERYPQWVREWCAKRPADRYAHQQWVLLNDRSTYLFRDVTNDYPEGSQAEKNMLQLQNKYGFGRTFPHPLKSGATLYNNLTLAPQGDELVATFAKELIVQEGLGVDAIPDYLGISFSINDYIGHWFSHSSLESEDTLLRLDRTLASLFAFIDSRIGLANTLIVLSGDHGAPEYPETLASIGATAAWIPRDTVVKTATDAVAAAFGTTDPLISMYSAPYFYLDQDLLRKHGLKAPAVQQVIATAVAQIPGIAVAIPVAQLAAGGGDAQADEDLLRRIRNNYHRERSGDVHVVQDPHWQIEEANDPKLLQHSTPWSYDVFVPIAFAGAGVPAARVYRDVSTVDVAPTLSVFVRAKFPSGSVGVPLKEVFARPR